MSEEKIHKAGFVSIIGKPNVGKSTLMNALIGEKLSITTSKAQTTRHRIFGIINGDDFQIVYSDTPGILDPKYKLQSSMMNFVSESLQDADLIIYMVDLEEKADNMEVVEKIQRMRVPVLFVMNKVDVSRGSQADDKMDYWKKNFHADHYLQISALEHQNLEELLERILQYMPEHPAYFPEDTITDRSERFFAGEIVREKIFLNYEQEIPYSTQVEITEFKESEDIIRMRAVIYVERDSQKGIIIGKKGASLKKVGMESRLDLEHFFNKKVHIETHVKVEKDWRKKELKLKKFGYSQ